MLAPLSALYALISGTRRLMLQTADASAWGLDVPVIVVGNLTAGGTGKTPLVIWLTQALQARGLRVGVVSRGHGRADDAMLRDVTPQTAPADSGDEPLLIARSTGAPVVVGRDRLAACRRLAQRGVQLIVADDGLQHYRMPRALEIVVIDGQRGLGNGWLLPAGPLRERAGRLRDVAAIVYNDAADTRPQQRGATAFSMQLRPSIARNLQNGGRQALQAFAATGPVHAVAGIGNPQRFFGSLRAAGLQLIEHPFADHHAFRADELNFGDRKAVLMTAKDAVKCSAFADERLWEVPVDAEFAAGDGERLLTLVMNCLPAPLRR